MNDHKLLTPQRNLAECYQDAATKQKRYLFSHFQE